jgi:predicted nucleic acid-binding protein
MIAVDTSVIAAALMEHEPQHGACRQLLEHHRPSAWVHLISEIFATLTGGRHGWRLLPTVASQLVDLNLLPRLRFAELSAADISAALHDAQALGVRGGAVYDYLHLVAARKAGAHRFYTLNVRHFAAVARHGDPEISLPES